MHVVDLHPERARPIAEYASRASSAQPLAHGRGEAHAKGSDTGLTAVMIQIAELEATS